MISKEKKQEIIQKEWKRKQLASLETQLASLETFVFHRGSLH